VHLLLALLLALPQTDRAPDSLLVEVAGRVTVLRTADLAALPRDTARTRIHGGPQLTYTGVQLTEVLRRVGVATDSLRGPALVTRLLVEASDGYRVVFSLPELAPSFGERRVLLVDQVDGHPLPASEGPWRLAAAGDAGEHARWVRQVVAIRVRRD
jgi:hypothetical protein